MRAQAERRILRLLRTGEPGAARAGVEEGIDHGIDHGIDDEDGGRSRVLLGPWGRPALRGLLLLVLMLALIVGYLTWQSRPLEATVVPKVLSSGVPITDAATPVAETAAPVVEEAAAAPAVDVVVHVSGAVRRPGLVRLSSGSRVADAIAAAGGVTPRGTQESVNLARIVVDGEQIVVTDVPATSPVALPGAPQGAVIDLNAATVEQLDGLPGVGPVLAGRIVQWRTAHGRFSSIDELGEVSGIGDAILAQLRPLVRV